MRRGFLLAALILLAIVALRRPMFDHVVRQMLYPAPPVTVPSPPPAPLEEVELGLAGGIAASAWAYRHEGDGGSGAPAVLFFHGNGENLATLEWSGLYDQVAALGVHFLAVDYPGYGRSTGTPSQASLTAAGSAGFEWLRERFPRSPRVVLGWSLGAAVALQTAARHAGELDGLILLSAWDDLGSLGKVHFPGWLVAFGIKDRYDSAAVAPSVDCPVLMIHGENDDLIPIDHGRRLAGAFARQPRWLAVPDTGHNDLLARRRVWREMQDFLASLPGPAAGPR